MELTDFEGRTYGPLPWHVAIESVKDFVSLTRDDPDRWTDAAPPGFAASALFAVAPDLLADLYDRSVVHGEQAFNWEQPIRVGSLLQVGGTVTRVRERGGVHFITFETEATASGDTVLTGRSLFLVSGEALAAGQADFERTEPPHSHRGELAAGQVAASRDDLVRYASATRDWNPVHWDHDAAVAAGFPGVVVHGLLQAGWALRAAGAGTSGDHPFASARFRFRNPLLPARPATITTEAKNDTIDVVLADDDVEYLTATVIADE
ncbi:MAG TPA: MaoC/PaaZ C-terminal domain-containing protein [Acidimicrobiia bacterium]